MLVGDVRWATTAVRMSLHIVGWQPTILGTDEGLEEGPGLAGHSTEEAGVAVRQPGSRRGTGRLDHQARGWNPEPQRQDGRGEDQRCRPKVSEKKLVATDSAGAGHMVRKDAVRSPDRQFVSCDHVERRTRPHSKSRL